jgi:hypothetical protein
MRGSGREMTMKTLIYKIGQTVGRSKFTPMDEKVENKANSSIRIRI